MKKKLIIIGIVVAIIVIAIILYYLVFSPPASEPVSSHKSDPINTAIVNRICKTVYGEDFRSMERDEALKLHLIKENDDIVTGNWYCYNEKTGELIYIDEEDDE